MDGRRTGTVTAFDEQVGLGEITADDGALVAWTADVLPAALAERFSPMMAAGLATMKAHLEKS